LAWQRRCTIVVAALTVAGCWRGSLPPRQFYRLAPPDSLAALARVNGAPPLTGSIAIPHYDTPGIYGSGALVYRVGTSAYGAYPAREWAIPLGEMLASMTEGVLRQRALTSGRVEVDPPAAARDPYEWRGVVREFDEVDAPTSVSASVSLSALLVRVADDSVVWSGSTREIEPVKESRNIDSVVASLSAAAARALVRLTDEAASTLRRLAAAGAQDR
jgi:ABC-type uncharacterized transport system auxiliary subunit